MSIVHALLKIFFFGEDNRHNMFLISPVASYFYYLMNIAFSRKSFDAVILGLSST
jgi:hypothetical protein